MNQFAESAADVGDGMSRSASVLAQAGASIEESAGMFTGMQEVMQDSGVAGSALKIMTLRIRGKISASILGKLICCVTHNKIHRG